MWLHVVRAIEALKPCLVVIENVRGLLTSPAGSPGDVEPCPWCLGDTAGQPAVRALGAVLGSLADLGFDARWCVLRASDVGAPHRRERVFLTAWPTERDAAAEDTDQQLGDERRQSAPNEAETRRPRPEPGRRGGMATAHPESIRRGEGLSESAPWERGLDPAIGCGFPAGHHDQALHSYGQAPLDTRGRSTFGSDAHLVRAGGSQSWGPYAAAIARWERATRPAPRPTDAAGRLSPLFVEWMQGLAQGWVTATPGLGRPAQLAALGNGVVPQQAAHALRLLTPQLGACRHHRPR
ncbi:DNA cytosine methyltransferase [Streptomyces sp. SID5785]|uniref:DNA cytosine methyltransferase n=1 Tax=Streptomyces sp. SID5785 TaxID=2690309 RepID=UPI0023510E8E|nr:DNA cytosine methyltransferase [Streptomyces sp. SID5785]